MAVWDLARRIENGSTPSHADVARKNQTNAIITSFATKSIASFFNISIISSFV